MNRNIIHIVGWGMGCLLMATACTRNDESVPVEETGVGVPFDMSRQIQTEIQPYENEDGSRDTRVNMSGNQFETNDKIRLRIIAPFVDATQFGESTYGTTYDNWYLLKWTGANANWANLTTSDGYDIDADLIASGSRSLDILTQSTPYVFTATTWTEEHHIVLPSTSTAGSLACTFSNIFKADQRDKSDYKASDVLWAQQFMQTATENVRLSFQHKMAALEIDVTDFADELTGSEEVVLTLENMPDMDQQEVVIGNYYANQIKTSSNANFSEKTRSSCTKEQNGQVLGIVVHQGTMGNVGSLVRKTFIELPQDATYTAHRGTETEGMDMNNFYLIIPPYTVPAETIPTLWLRQGERRWSVALPLPTDRTFKSGKRYRVAMKKP